MVQEVNTTHPSFATAINKPINFLILVGFAAFVLCFVIHKSTIVYKHPDGAEVSINPLPEISTIPVISNDDPDDLPHLPKGSPHQEIIQRASYFIANQYPNFKGCTPKWYKQWYGFEAIYHFPDGRCVEIEFDQQGNWVETELENLDRAKIPQPILDSLAARFPGAPILEYEIEITGAGKFHEIEILENGTEHEYYFNADGVFYKNKNEDKSPGIKI